MGKVRPERRTGNPAILVVPHVTKDRNPIFHFPLSLHDFLREGFALLPLKLLIVSPADVEIEPEQVHEFSDYMRLPINLSLPRVGHRPITYHG